MSNRWNYIFGAATITLIVGGTAYAIYKSYQAKKEEESEISLDEAKHIVDNGRKEESKEVVKAVKVRDYDEEFKSLQDLEDEFEEALYEVLEEDDDPENYNAEYSNESYTVEPLVDFAYFDPDENINSKEDTVLRHNPDSIEAKHQYIRMELADWSPDHTVYRLLLQMYEFPFIPTNDGDEILRNQIIDYKVQFFGFGSKWNKEISYADVILHFSRLAEFNFGDSVKDWAELFMSNLELDWDDSSRTIDSMILRLNNHSYFNETGQTFGLFGLDRNSIDDALRTASRNIDKSLTYEIEFNEFLKSTI